MLECLKKLTGLEDKELSEDSLENIDLKGKLILKCIKNFICFLRVISLKIKKF